MKNIHQILYGVAGLLLLIVLFGGTLTKPIFNNFSTRTMETAGVRKAAIDSLDGKIDDMIFGVKKVQLQIDKIKNIFSDKEIDESKYIRVKNEIFKGNIYDPVNELIIVFYRTVFFFISIIILLSAIIFQLFYRSLDLRRRIGIIEQKLITAG
jgi:hypothetical protein